jgi:hypothetical protein
VVGDRPAQGDAREVGDVAGDAAPTEDRDLEAAGVLAALGIVAGEAGLAGVGRATSGTVARGGSSATAVAALPDAGGERCFLASSPACAARVKC